MNLLSHFRQLGGVCQPAARWRDIAGVRHGKM